jgi:signal transduction histidine kinase
MTEQLARLVEQQRSFASDASHQLRTPLTALRLQLERAGEVLPTDPERARELIEAAGVETERLQRMVEGLLVLARSTSRAAPTEPIDLAEIAAERAEVWRPLAADRGIDVQASTSGPARARAVPGTVEQIVDNYLDNAISLAPEGSVVEVVVTSSNGQVEAHVLDRGPGLADEQLAHAFDRFWRSPSSTHDGSGLGLAIVQHLATVSGGEVALANRPGGGIDASLVLPAS